MKILTITGLLFFPLITLMYQLNINCGAIDGYFGMEYFHMDWFGYVMTLEVLVLFVFTLGASDLIATYITKKRRKAA